MKILRSLLSALLACAVTCAGAAANIAGTPVFAAEFSSSYSYDNINASESKVVGAVSPEIEVQNVEASDENPFNVFDIYNAHQSYSLTHSGKADYMFKKSEGIDVSRWQGTINWEKVAATGIDYAIINAGYGKELYQKDPKFDENMRGAQSVGLDCGAYWYSYALSVEDAYKEAEVCYEVIKNYDFTYPIYFDIEDPSQKNLSTAEVSAIIDAFCSTLQAKGYYVGLYSFANFLTTRVYEEVLDKYDIWVAHFKVNSPSYFKEYGMWQYSSEGRVDGIEGDVDRDHSYINYPYLISPNSYVFDGGESGKADNLYPVTINKGKAKGIDVSVWQGEIDWKQVAESDVDFAVIRAGYGKLVTQKDRYFDENIAGAEGAGLDCGVYWYSYAHTPEEAVLEAEACYEVIKNHRLSYPVYFDIEDQSLADLSQQELGEIVKAFCSTLEKKHYYVGIKSYSNFLNTRLDSSLYSKYDVWVAHYGVSQPSFKKNYNMWQFCNDAEIKGISGPVNCNYAYMDFPSIMKKAHLNGF